MILGTDRVEQMTKTYNDIDMVTHLAERDRDLELAARIGQALLKRNHVLSDQNKALEEQLGEGTTACDCIKELHETNAQMSRMTEELSGKSDELIRYQEEISSLLSQIIDLQPRLKEHVIEKEELRLQLQASKDGQRQLTMELRELQDKNMECLGMLHESQEEIKELRSRSGPAAHLYFSPSCGPFTGESLAAEIEGTMHKKLILDEESSLFKQNPQQKWVFDTVKVANDTRGLSVPLPALLPIPRSNRSSVIMTTKPFESGVQQTEDRALLGQGSDSKEVPGGSQPRSHPGPSGDSDLDIALHHLSLHWQNYFSEKQFFAEEWKWKIQVLADQKEGVSGCDTPTECLASLCTDQLEISSASCLRGFMPEKLQIVKALEGSQTLHHWQQLAQPNFGTILDT
ncbi:Trafficking kinesin-binding protein 2 [Heterocephalus glaber]|uniref:Trafficking kinesin-binding protein 2 n=1 Tax=Heterocephalus glaber TaxID=10181 RepID=G5ALL0_HETGA|nr:Trafficking kinesin-binding protein 2 [Heterocephalus glaber]